MRRLSISIFDQVSAKSSGFKNNLTVGLSAVGLSAHAKGVFKMTEALSNS